MNGRDEDAGLTVPISLASVVWAKMRPILVNGT